MVHLNDLKIATYIINHNRTYSKDFGECPFDSLFTEVQKIFLHITNNVVKFFKCSGKQTKHSMKLEFGMHIIGHY